MSRRILSIDVGIRTLSLCLMVSHAAPLAPDAPWSRYEVEHLEKVDVLVENGSAAKRCASVTLCRTIDYVLASLRRREAALFGSPDRPVSNVVIEAFVGRARDAMKCVTAAIYAYFRQLLRDDARVGVELFHAKHKLTVVGGDVETPSDAVAASARDDAGARYRRNKKQAKERWEATMRLLRNPDASVAYYLAEKKKRDDLADCSLQAIAWFERGEATAQKRSRARKTPKTGPARPSKRTAAANDRDVDIVIDDDDEDPM